MIPATVDGNPVIWVYRLDPPVFLSRSADDGLVEKTAAFLVSVADEGSEDERFLVACLGESGRVTAGHVFHSLAEAKRYPAEGLDIVDGGWTEFERRD
jgi:hypothetical protein